MDTANQSHSTVGVKYSRDCIEIHRRFFDKELRKWAGWYCVARTAKTIEEARAQLGRERKWYGHGAGLLETCDTQFRIVRVVASCEVVE